MLSVVEGPVVLGTVSLRKFTHLIQVNVEQTVPRQELYEVEVHPTPFQSSNPRVRSTWLPPSSSFLPTDLPTVYVKPASCWLWQLNGSPGGLKQAYAGRHTVSPVSLFSASRSMGITPATTSITGSQYSAFFLEGCLALLDKGKGFPITSSSFRLLCMLDCTGKIFERIIRTRLRRAVKSGIGLADNQYGFREGRSTVWFRRGQINSSVDRGGYAPGPRSLEQTAGKTGVGLSTAGRSCPRHVLNMSSRTLGFFLATTLRTSLGIPSGPGAFRHACPFVARRNFTPVNGEPLS